MAETQFLEPEEGKDLRVTYPFLDTITEFNRLTAEELRFAREYGLQSGECFSITDEKEKIAACCKIAFGTNQRKALQYSQQIPPQVLAACRRMEIFNHALRSRAFAIYSDVLDTQEKLLKETKNLLKNNEGQTDMKAAKEFVALSNDILTGLPSIIEKLEGGIGIKEKNAERGTGRSDIFTATLMQRTGL